MAHTRRKRGMLIGLTLLSAAALVAFGTVQSRRRGPITASDAVEHDEADDIENRGLWGRVRDVGQAAYLLLTQRRPNDS